MFNSVAALFQQNSVWGLSSSNTANIIAQGNPIHIVVGGNDSLLGPDQGFDAWLTSFGIGHDALQVVAGCGHDAACDWNGINNANWAFASSHFP